MNFSALDDSEKTLNHTKLLECATAFGGVNSFLTLIEELRKTKPHALLAKDCEFRCHLGTIKWNKVIFEDKLNLLLKARLGESKKGNLLPDKDDKAFKNVLNLVRALKPIEFVAKRKNIKDGEGFSLNAVDIKSDEVTRINPLFDALFFSSIDTVKKVLNYETKGQ